MTQPPLRPPRINPFIDFLNKLQNRRLGRKETVGGGAKRFFLDPESGILPALGHAYKTIMESPLGYKAGTAGDVETPLIGSWLSRKEVPGFYGPGMKALEKAAESYEKVVIPQVSDLIAATPLPALPDTPFLPKRDEEFDPSTGWDVWKDPEEKDKWLFGLSPKAIGSEVPRLDLRDITDPESWLSRKDTDFESLKRTKLLAETKKRFGDKEPTPEEYRQIEEEMYPLPWGARFLLEETPGIIAGAKMPGASGLLKSVRLRGAAKGTLPILAKKTPSPLLKYSEGFPSLPDPSRAAFTRAEKILEPIAKLEEKFEKGITKAVKAPFIGAKRGFIDPLKPGILSAPIGKGLASPFKATGSLVNPILRSADELLTRLSTRDQPIDIPEVAKRIKQPVVKLETTEQLARKLEPLSQAKVLTKLQSVKRRQQGIINRERELSSGQVFTKESDKVSTEINRVGSDLQLKENLPPTKSKNEIREEAISMFEKARTGTAFGEKTLIPVKKRKEPVVNYAVLFRNSDAKFYGRSAENVYKETIEQLDNLRLKDMGEKKLSTMRSSFGESIEFPINPKHDVIEEAIKGQYWKKHQRDIWKRIKNNPDIGYGIGRFEEQFPNAAHAYISMIQAFDESMYMLRLIEDMEGARLAGKMPTSQFNEYVKKYVSVADRLIRSFSGAIDMGNRRYLNFMKDKIEPLLAKGIRQDDIDKRLFGLRFTHLKSRPDLGLRKNPRIFDPDRALQGLWDPTQKGAYREVSDAELAQWANIKSSYWRSKGYTDDQLKAIEDGAIEVFNLYDQQRDRLVNAGIFTRKLANDLSEGDPYYHPIKYMEHKDIGKGDFSEPLTKGRMNVATNGIRSLSKEVESLGALSPLGEVMAETLIQNELRIVRNTITRDVVDKDFGLGVFQEFGLTDVSHKFREYQYKTAKNKVLKTVRKESDIPYNIDKEFDVKMRLKDIPYNDSLDTGYFSYYKNGQRIVLGNSQGKEIPKDLWGMLNGSGGLAVRTPNEISNWLAASNGWFRSLHTTYNPLFIVRNGLVDMFSVQMRAGVGIHHTGARIMKSVWNLATKSEDSFKDIIEEAGGFTGGYFNSRLNHNKILNILDKSNVTQNATIVGTGKNALERTLKEKILEASKNLTYRWIPKVGGAVEQSPRLAASEKTLKKLIGKKEYDRIFKRKSISKRGKGTPGDVLTHDEWTKELKENWNPVYDVDGFKIRNRKHRGIGLLDSDEVKKAAQISNEATIDFARGGRFIKWLNNYVLFLNVGMESMKLPFRTLGLNLHPVIKRVENPKPGGPLFEFGTLTEQAKHYFSPDGRKRGLTGKTFDVVGGGPKMAALRLGTATTGYFIIQNYWNKQFVFNGIPIYYDVPEYIRYNSMIIMLDSDKDENGEYIINPKTGRPIPKYIVVPHRLREWNLFFQIMTFIDEGTDDEVAFDKSAWVKEIMGNVTPFTDDGFMGEGLRALGASENVADIVGAFGSTVTPELANVFAEELMNKDYFTGKNILEEDEKELPVGEQYDRTTPRSARALAGILEDVPVPEPIGNLIKSPKRLDHLYKNVFGWIGKEVPRTIDKLFSLEGLVDHSDRPMKEIVKEYREDMTKVEQDKFKVALSSKEYEEFEKELKESDVDTPFLSSLKRSYFPERGGGLYRRGASEAEKLFEDKLDQSQQRQARKEYRTFERARLTKQQTDDTGLTNWTFDKEGNKTTSTEWRKNHSDKYAQAQVDVEKLAYRFPKSLYAQPPEVRDEYYTALFTAAGKMPDIRDEIGLLLNGYYAIQPSTDDPDSIDWNNYFAAIDEFKRKLKVRSDSLGTDLYARFEEARISKLTPAEIAFDKAKSRLRPYWNVGRDVTELLPILRGNSEEAQRLWDSYLNGTKAEKNKMYRENKFIKSLVERRTKIRKILIKQDDLAFTQTPDSQKNYKVTLEELLVYWYGGEYYTRPITERGKIFYDKLYNK